MAYKVSYYIIIMSIIHVSCYTEKKTIFKNLKVELSIVATFFSSKNVLSIYTLANSEPSKLTWHMWTSPGISEMPRYVPVTLTPTTGPYQPPLTCLLSFLSSQASLWVTATDFCPYLAQDKWLELDFPGSLLICVKDPRSQASSLISQKEQHLLGPIPAQLVSPLLGPSLKGERKQITFKTCIGKYE